MGFPNRLSRGVSACALGLAAVAAQAQTEGEQAPRHTDAVVDPTVARQQAREIAQGDPARWYRNDQTRQARLKTLQKEIGAALNEARNACRKQPAAERGACMKEANATWQQDMAQAKAQVEQEQ
ncbi:hypothetical protein [Massilia sp. DD77]|uniref:hypothetical protein n=1 Tax=Massilia sp. DD77 TaxID=3109349 RepID=UPI002FFF06DF